MDQRTNSELSAAGLNDTGALCLPTNSTGGIDVGLNTMDTGCDESTQCNLEIEMQSNRDSDLLCLL